MTKLIGSRSEGKLLSWLDFLGKRRVLDGITEGPTKLTRPKFRTEYEPHRRSTSYKRQLGEEP